MNTKKLKRIPNNSRLIARGILNWNRSERVSDRYGTVTIYGEDMERGADLSVNESAIGALLVRVIEARESSHIGDFFRGLSPRTPKTGDIIELGRGELFTEKSDGVISVGVKPDDQRTSDWLNPRALYDVHESVVELIFSAVKQQG